MSTPTQQQVQNVQANVKNMMAWVNHLHSYLQDIINETYDYISLNAAQDPGQSFVDNLIYAMITGGVGSLPGLGILGDFLGGMFHTYVTSPPPSLKGVLAGVWDRFDKSFLQANTDLALIYNDVVGSWNKFYTGPSSGNRVAVSAWGDKVIVPAPTSNQYQTMTDNAVQNYKVNLAKTLLRDKYQVISDPQGTFFAISGDANAIAFIKKWEKSNPAYFMQAGHDTGGSICPQKGYTFVEPFLGYGSSDPLFAHPMPATTCNWLMKDDGWGTIVNPDGLATRAQVFCEWGLKCSMDISRVGKIAPNPWSIPNGCISNQEAPQEESKNVVVREEGLVEEWHKLFEKTPRHILEQQVIDKALEDDVFHYELLKRPKEAIRSFLGICLPEHVSLEVIEERGGEYKLVIPWAGRRQWRKFVPDHWLVRFVKWLVGQK